MRKFMFLLALIVSLGSASAQNTFKGSYHNSDLNIRMQLSDLSKADIPIPGLELDSCYGYLQGRINSSWIILKVKKVEDGKALVRVMCEKGDVAEDIEITLTETGASMTQVSDAFIKGIGDRKYVKLPKVILFTKD